MERFGSSHARLLALLILGSAEWVVAAPKMVVSEPGYEFGSLPHTESIQRSFTVTNAGDEELVISSVHPHCSACTQARIDQTKIAPGSHAEVSWTVQLHLQPKGLFNKGIDLLSNDPNQAKLTYWIKGDVSVEIELIPRSLSLNVVPLGGTATGAVEIVSNSDTTFSIDRVVSNRGLCSAKIREIEKGKRYAVDIVMEGKEQKREDNLPGYYLQDTLVAYLNHDTIKVVPITVRGMLKQPLYVSPDAIVLSGKPGARVSRNLLCRTDLSDALTLSVGEWPGGQDGSILKVMRMNAKLTRIALQNLPVDPALNGKELIIKTNIPGKEVVHIPIRVIQAP